MQDIELPTVDMTKVGAMLAEAGESLEQAFADVDTTELREGHEQPQETFRHASEQILGAEAPGE